MCMVDGLWADGAVGVVGTCSIICGWVLLFEQGDYVYSFRPTAMYSPPQYKRSTTIWKKHNERPNVGGVSIRRERCSVSKGMRGLNGQMTKASIK